MRIGFDAKRAFHNASGLGNYSRNIIIQLADLYPENEYFLYNPRKSKAFSEFPPTGIKERNPEAITPPFFWRSWKIPALLEKDNVDIYHGLSNELPFGMSKFSGKKLVSIHDLIFLKFPGLYNRADRIIYAGKFSHAARIADKIIAISEQTKRDIVYHFNTDPNKIEVVYQDCAPIFYHWNASELLKKKIKEKYDLPSEFILYVGTIEKRKNLLSILKAIHHYNIDIPLVVAGRATSYKKEVVAFIEKNAMRNISFLENAVHEDLPEIYRQASIFVYPSSYEGFGIPVLEALNSGVPVITATGSCLEETGGDAALYADPLNIEELASQIARVMDDSALRSTMIEKGKRHALNFRPERTTRKIMDIYKKLVDCKEI
jgi:glycosyltransferase involved in cell wall biosynthesis